jgi:hypothetical protein
MRLLDRLRRMNYFTEQLLTAEDLGRDQQYFRDRLRRHNRNLHGWGVVSGLGVAVQDNDGTVTVTVAPGYALSPQGDEIVVAEQVSLAPPAGEAHWVVAARYDERLVEPLPAAGAGAGDPGVRFAATEETSVVEVLVALPQDADSPWVTLAELHRSHGNPIQVHQGGRRRAEGP